MTRKSETCHSIVVIMVVMVVDMLVAMMKIRDTNHIIVVAVDKIVGISVSKAAGLELEQSKLADLACCRH